MELFNYGYKKRGDFFKSLPSMEDWHQVIAFEKIVKNYIKMKDALNRSLKTDVHVQ